MKITVHCPSRLKRILQKSFFFSYPPSTEEELRLGPEEINSITFSKMKITLVIICRIKARAPRKEQT